MSWDPNQYLKFEGARLRPALDLLARVTLEAPRTVVDLGCGTGNVTRILAQRWPDARVVAVDNSAQMLAKARAAARELPNVTFAEADLATWQPAAPVDVLYSNAALHWLPDHHALLPRVAAMVAAGGTLAVQMPDNFGAPSHTTVAELAQSPRWRTLLAHVVRDPPVAPAAAYFRWLGGVTTALDIWTTEYLQVLPAGAGDEHPVAAWTRGTWLVPVLAALDAHAQRAFLAEYSQRLAVAYPPLPDGRVLFPFRRLFLIGNR